MSGIYHPAFSESLKFRHGPDPEFRIFWFQYFMSYISWNLANNQWPKICRHTLLLFSKTYHTPEPAFCIFSISATFYALLNSSTMDVRHLSSGIFWIPKIPAWSRPWISHFLVSIFYVLYVLESGKQPMTWNMQAYPALILWNLSCSGTCILHFLYPTFYALLNSGTMDIRHLSSSVAINYSGIISTLFR